MLFRSTDGDGSAAGTYYFIVSTNTLTDHTYSPSQTQDLMESGGKSSWGNKDVKGAIVWVRAADSHSGFTNTFYAYLIDSANHGIDTITQENAINRTAVKTAVNANSTYSTKLNNLANLKTALQNNKGSISANFTTTPTAIECHLAQ